MAEIRDRLGQLIDVLQQDAGNEFRQWRPAPTPPPALTKAEGRAAALARQSVMADIRRRPAGRPDA